MPQRHSKNNNDLAFFTSHTMRSESGTQKERLGKDSIKPFDACSLCLKPVIDPMCCQKGHIFGKECIFECLLAQKKIAAHAVQQKQENEEEEEKLMLQKAAIRIMAETRNGYHGANSVKATSYEEEALRTMKAFWLPSATPEAPVKVEAPYTSTTCPEGNEKLKMKTLFPIHFTEDTNEEKQSTSLDQHIGARCPKLLWTRLL